jgi:hypothetical protein
VENEIRGAVGHLAETFQLSDAATTAIYSLYCEQAKRWEEKLVECAERIRNQRSEINRLMEQMKNYAQNH